MNHTWETLRRGPGEETIFNLDRQVVHTGSAGTRCFRDLLSQRGRERALLAVERGIREIVNERRFPEGRGFRTFEITVESILLGAGVPAEQVPAYANSYRRGRNATADLSEFE